MNYKTGTLIEFRNRPWVVQQSGEDHLMIIKPLGGTDAETIGLYLPLYGDELQIRSYNFCRPSADDIGKTVIRHLQRCFTTHAVCRSATLQDLSNAWESFLSNRAHTRWCR